MAHKVGDVMFPNGTYMKEGEQKTAWLKCGAVFQTDNGLRIKLDCLPVNMQEGWFSVFENQQSNTGRTAQTKSKAPSVPSDDDMPF